MTTMLIGESTVELDIDLPGILDNLERRVAVVAHLVREGVEPQRSVPRLSWTVGQLTAHLAATADNYARMARGEEAVADPVSERRTVIDRGINEHLHQTPTNTAAVIESGVAEVIDAFQHCSDDERRPYYGMDAPPSLIAGMFLSELVVHGVDLARAQQRHIDVPGSAAYASLLASSALTPFVLTEWGRTRTMTVGYAPRGHKPIIVALDRGKVTVAHHSQRAVDAWFAGSAAALLLAAYHRTGTLRALTTLRLRGRRPYLALLADRAFETA